MIPYALILLATCTATAAAGDSQIIVGNIRVQALSPTLVRVEPMGPLGFEDRTTFMVTDRGNFAGIPLTSAGTTATGTILSTEYYRVLLRKKQWEVCGAPQENTDASGSPTRSQNYPNGAHAQNVESCCRMCESDETCNSYVYQPSAHLCYPLSSYGATRAASDRLFATVSRPDTRKCASPMNSTDAGAPVRSRQYPNGIHAASAEQCCEKCMGDPTCSSYVYQPSGGNCWPLSASGLPQRDTSDRVFAHVGSKSGPSFQITKPSGEVIYDTDTDTSVPNMLHWPAPLSAQTYALTDRPRFFVPEWGTAPIPSGAKVDPALKSTNGYDFRNNVVGDTYVFILGSDLTSWSSSRAEFLQLAGSCPLLPDFAYGTWFTYWYSYTESEAKDDISHWEELKLPIDVWALDMNWRNTSQHQDWYYKYPATQLFPNFTEWFEYLKEHKLRTYFNDHPYPVQDRHAGGGQTSAEEVAFRWNGLSEWMEKGLTYWWFDHNWGFSIPPPFVDNGGHTDGIWEGLDNAAWGSHVYYNAVKYFDKTVRDPRGDAFYGGRPIALTKFARPDWRPGMDPYGHAEHPSQHRFPVWWTGDGVSLQASVESMVDAGLYDFKPFVHSDCGGDYKGSAGDLMRWTAHCAYGSILRFHGNDHRSWKYGTATVNTVRSYLNARYKLMPSIIAAGQVATNTGLPLVARGDFYWPEHKESATNLQYIFLDDILVAPIFDSKANETSRSVWIPPGDWEDAWDGSITTGPKTITATQPYERQPMWMKRDGGLLVLTDKPGTRVDTQDWSSLTLEAFPSASAMVSTQSIFERGSEAHTDISCTTDGKGSVQFRIGHAPTEREWMLRVHLRSGERVASTMIDGQRILDSAKHLQPRVAPDYFPLNGVGTSPPLNAGPVAEVMVPKGKQPRVVNLQIETETSPWFV